MTNHPHRNTPQQARIHPTTPNITPPKSEQNRTNPYNPEQGNAQFTAHSSKSAPTAQNFFVPAGLSRRRPDILAINAHRLGKANTCRSSTDCPTRCGSHARTLGRCSLPKCPVFRDVAPGPSRQRKRSGSWKASPLPLLSRIRSAANLSRRKSLKPGSWSWRCEIPRSDPQAAQTGLRVRAAGTGISRDMGQARYRIGRDGPRLGQQGSQAWHCAICRSTGATLIRPEASATAPRTSGRSDPSPARCPATGVGRRRLLPQAVVRDLRDLSALSAISW